MYAPLIVAMALAAAPTSKLGPHVGRAGAPGTLTLLNACPRVAKWIAGPSANLELNALRLRCPGTVTVLRPGVSLAQRYDVSADPAKAADDYWNRVVGDLAGLDPACVDWLEGPNETEAIDWTRNLAAADWYARLWSRLADRINGAGYHPLVGSIPAGAPALAGELSANSPNLFTPIATAMKQKAYRWGWSYHAYSRDLSKDLVTEASQSLRYRTIRDQAGLAGIPLVLSEGGQGPTSGWRSRATSAETYLDWLAWYDDRMQEDADVIGVALFQVGDQSKWAGFDLTPIATELAALITSEAADGGIRRDGGTGPDAGRRDGGGSGSVTPGPGPGPLVPRDANGMVFEDVPEEEPKGCGCSSAGAASAPAALLAAALLRRRRRGDSRSR